ncbi:DUF2007 domain-containing protein [Thiocapsa sp.]|uniref:putative signal transducing protein n=1 Tax=Thiocapsa sp. TaxID=2024551 RepID=UPI003592F163
MQRLYQARDRIEAQLVLDFLDRHRLEAVILGDYLSGAAGGLPVDIGPTLWVVEDDELERGRTLLGRFQADALLPSDPATWHCAGCGESVDGGFDLCWNCGQARSETGS